MMEPLLLTDPVATAVPIELYDLTTNFPDASGEMNTATRHPSGENVDTASGRGAVIPEPQRPLAPAPPVPMPLLVPGAPPPPLAPGAPPPPSQVLLTMTPMGGDQLDSRTPRTAPIVAIAKG